MTELITYSSTQALLDDISEGRKKLVSDVVPTKVGVGVIQHVLQKLLSEHVSIKDLPLILEAIAETYQSNQNTMVKLNMYALVLLVRSVLTTLLRLGTYQQYLYLQNGSGYLLKESLTAN